MKANKTLIATATGIESPPVMAKPTTEKKPTTTANAKQTVFQAKCPLN
jgi:hypothetical protein